MWKYFSHLFAIHVTCYIISVLICAKIRLHLHVVVGNVELYFVLQKDNVKENMGGGFCLYVSATKFPSNKGAMISRWMVWVSPQNSLCLMC